jgi:outer membrane protein OmpA-like peptidoglycan-associated protein/tetratricopeptide (TPR) repeat protein
MKYHYKTFILISLISVLAAFPARAQKELKQANRHYDNFEYTLALDYYQRAIAKKQPTLESAQRMADAFRLTDRTSEAENWYAEVLKFPHPHPVNIFYYAEMLRANGKYAEARAQYLQYATKAPAEYAQANKMVEAVDKAMEWLKRPPSAEVNLANGLNSPNADFSPTFYKDGIVFTSDRSTGQKDESIYGWTGRPYLKLYASTKTGEDTWSPPALIQTAVNAKYHNGPAVATTDNKTLFFTRTNMVPKRGNNINNDPTNWAKAPLGSDYINRLEIFSAEQQGTEWVNIKPFPYNKVAEYSVGHPALSPDGKILYFASDMPGGLGETDIYYSEKKSDGSWSKPVNAGPAINTPGKEVFPALAADGTFYFSSDRHPGFGGLDIFSAKGSRSDWRQVTNMYAPLNSAKDDYGIMPDATGRAGFLSSNRASSTGTADIYTFRLLLKPSVIAVTTLERKQDNKIKTQLVPLQDVRLRLSQPKSPDSTIALTDFKGHYNFDVKKGFTYKIVGAKDGFLTQSGVVPVDTTSKSDTLHITLTFDRNIVNRAIVLENIFFDLDKYNIRPDAASELDKLVQVLKDNPKIKIEMGAHCDSRESPEYNQLLSENRAKATVDYLVSKGISRGRLTAKGYGETRHVNRCYDGVSCSEEEHQQNRRTEFKIRQ